MGLSVTIGTINPFLSIPGDRAPDLKGGGGEEGGSGEDVFDSIFGDVAFTMDISFTYMSDDEVPEEYEITAIESSIDLSAETINMVTTGNTVDISGTYVSIFPEFWEFAMRDRTNKRLQINKLDNEDWVAITRWIPPSIVEKMATFTFIVTYYDEMDMEEKTVTKTVPQYVYWNYVPSLAKLKNFVKQGEF